MLNRGGGSSPRLHRSSQSLRVGLLRISSRWRRLALSWEAGQLRDRLPRVEVAYSEDVTKHRGRSTKGSRVRPRGPENRLSRRIVN